MFRLGKKKKKAQEQKKQQLPAAAIDESSYDQWVDHSKPTNPPVDEGTYDTWIDDAEAPSNPQVEDEYDDWSTSDHHLQKPAEQPPKVEDFYDDFAETKEDAGNQEYEEVEEEGDIFGFDNKKGASKHTATSPSWVNKPPAVKGAPPSIKKVISVQPPQDEYEDVMGEGDIFGFDDKKGSSTKATSPSWANKAPPVKGAPPSSKRPTSMQRPPDVPKNPPPSERPKSVQSPTYMSVKEAEPYEMPLGQNYVNVNRQEEGESYEEMEDLNLQPTYTNVTSQDVGGESYEEMDGLDLQSAPAAENDEYYEDVLPDDRVQKPPITASIAERQQQLQKKETKEPPKKRGLAADYQKMKFEMLAQKFKEIDSGEPKSEPAKITSDKKKATWPPKSGGNDEATPAKGTVTSLTRGFQGPGANKVKDKVNMKGLLWHKAPGRSKYHEEHCELDANNFKLFRNKNDPSPYFTINTTQCELASAPEEYEKKNVFKLTAGASRDYFGAFNASEMRAWMNALRPVVKTAK